MKFKLLCDRCLADKKAFQSYANPYNNGKCHKCNSHGYILTTDEVKAKESHLNYTDTIQHSLEALEIATLQEVDAIKALKQHRESHEAEHKEIYDKLEEALQSMLEAKQNNIELSPETMEEYKMITQQVNEAATTEYKQKERNLQQEVNHMKKVKEKAIKRLEEAQQFYIELLQPVSE
jgi:predicted RNase H-like HicB family nuclease